MIWYDNYMTSTWHVHQWPIVRFIYAHKICQIISEQFSIVKATKSPIMSINSYPETQHGSLNISISVLNCWDKSNNVGKTDDPTCCHNQSH